MKFYKYRDLSNAWPTLDILVNRRLFLAPLDSLNDPMEFKLNQAKAVIESVFKGHFLQPVNDSDERIIEIARMADMIADGDRFSSSGDLSLALLADPYSRVCSLSVNPYSMTMWSHYANGHQGVCLEFELAVGTDYKIPFAPEPVPVRYLDPLSYDKKFSFDHLTRTINRLERKVSPAFSNTQFLFSKLRKLYSSKIIDWSYEEEWRMFDRARRPYYCLREGEYLSKVLLGSRINKLHQGILRKIVPVDVPIVQTSVVGGVVKEAGSLEPA